jgi:hypothetical protein
MIAGAGMVGGGMVLNGIGQRQGVNAAIRANNQNVAELAAMDAERAANDRAMLAQLGQGGLVFDGAAAQDHTNALNADAALLRQAAGYRGPSGGWARAAQAAQLAGMQQGQQAQGNKWARATGQNRVDNQAIARRAGERQNLWQQRVQNASKKGQYLRQAGTLLGVGGGALMNYGMGQQAAPQAPGAGMFSDIPDGPPAGAGWPVRTFRVSGNDASGRFG